MEWGIKEQMTALVCFVLIVAFLHAIGFVNRGIEEERRQFAHDQDYDPRHVRLATVHARQDIMLLSYLMYWVVGLLAVLTGVVGANVIHHW